MSYPVVAIISAIVLGGLIGGSGSAIMQDVVKVSNDSRGAGRLSVDYVTLVKCLCLGVVAAVAVPFFLAVATLGDSQGLLSKILEAGDGKSADQWKSFFVLLAFCTLAAVSAQRFLQSLEEKILKRVDDAEAKADAAELKVSAMQEETRDAIEAVEDMTVAIDDPTAVADGVGEEADHALRAIIAAPQKLPSLKDLEQAWKGPAGRLIQGLNALEQAGLVRKVPEDREHQARWRLREWGKRRLYRVETPSKEDLLVLKAITTLRTERSIRRPTVRDIALHLGLDEAKIEQSLLRMLKFGFVAESTSVPGGWRIRGWGSEEMNRNRGEFDPAMKPT